MASPTPQRNGRAPLPRSATRRTPAPAPASGARRARRSRRAGSAAAVLMVVALLTLVLVKVTAGPAPSGGTTSPGAAVAAPVLGELISTPLAVQSAAGIGSQSAAPYDVLSGTAPLSLARGATTGSRSVATQVPAQVPELVYVGAEFCPYCAVERYALVLALSRFGTFHGLTTTRSGANDGDIPALSFHGASYESRYVAFRGYEAENRDGAPLDPPPGAIERLWTSQSAALVGSPSFPYLNLGGRFVLVGEPSGLRTTAATLMGSNGQGSGLTMSQIVAGIHSPGSGVGAAFDASAILSEANYLDAAVCLLDSGQPGTVCTSPGVRAAAQVLRGTTARRI